MTYGELQHHGVLGMKWGVRRAEKQRLKRESLSEEYVNARTKKQVKNMTTQELRDRTSRLQAEQAYKAVSNKARIGKQSLDTYLKVATTIGAIATATSVYKKYGSAVLDKVGKIPIAKIMS